MATSEDPMLKTRITEQYGLKVPFINAGMAFIATAPLARAVCEAGGMGMLGAAAMPPDVLQEAIRGIKAVNPACFGVDIIGRFAGSSILTCASLRRSRSLYSFGMTCRTSGYRVCRRLIVTFTSKLAAWTRRKPLSDSEPRGSLCKAARPAATTGLSRQRSHCFPQSWMRFLQCPSLPRAAFPTVGPLLLRWRLAPTRSGWELGYLRASRPMPIHNTRIVSSLPASKILPAI